MTCKECNSRNPIGNKFCRECGAKIVIPEGSLAAEEAARAVAERKSERAAILLADAHLLAEQGKYIGAIPIVEEAIATLPFSASAHTLLVTLYEHTDQREKAITAQEKVVELLPNAAHELNRLERLKRGERTSLPPTQSISAGNLPTLQGGTAPVFLPHWFPLAASAVAGGFALFFGFILMSPGNVFSKSRPVSSPTPIALISPTPQSPEIAINPGAMPPPAQDPNRGGDPFVSLDEVRRRAQADAARRTGTVSPTSINASTALPLPKTLTNPNASRQTSGPVVVSADILKGNKSDSNDEGPLPPITAAPPTASNDESGFGNGERLVAAPPGQEAIPQKKTGYMRIQVSHPATTAPIVAAPPKGKKNADMESDPMQKARTLQGLGHYAEAIAAYREAIAAGASEGEAQQGIALCYQRSEDISNARAAYQQAIAAYRAQIAAGRSPSSAQRGLNTCEAALGVLNGG